MMTILQLHRSSAVLSLLVAAASAGCGRGAAQDAPEDAAPATVRVAPVVVDTLVAPITVTGTVGPKDEIALSFKVGGVIEHVAVDAGDVVSAGATLAALDLREIDAALARATSAAEKAERDLARARRLYADSVMTLAQFQDAGTAAEVAAADLEAARFNRRYAVITAPSPGTILRRAAEPGELVSPAAMVLLLGSSRRGTVVRAGLSDRDVVRVRIGDVATARFTALPDRVFRGSVTEVGGAAEPGTGTWSVEVTLEDAAPLAAGMVGTVEIVPAAGAATPLIPVEAVLEADAGEATVFVLSADGSRAQRQRVRIGAFDGARVSITEGLSGAQEVVTEGAAWLDDGQQVKVLR